MTKRQYVHARAPSPGYYEFFPPYEGAEGRDFNHLQHMLSWAGERGWRLVCANGDFTEFVFERDAPLTVSLTAVVFEPSPGVPASTPAGE